MLRSVAPVRLAIVTPALSSFSITAKTPAAAAGLLTAASHTIDLKRRTHTRSEASDEARRSLHTKSDVVLNIAAGAGTRDEEKTTYKTWPPFAGDGVGAYYANKVAITSEIVASKLAPAGFAWQGGAVIAATSGWAATSANFALSTGICEAAGVITGHVVYNSLKGALGYKSDVKQDVEDGLFLGTATFCSGVTWQPALNYFMSTGIPYTHSALGVGVACATAFFGGLQVGRVVYPAMGWTSGSMVKPISTATILGDLGLVFGIGGATAAFVFTDGTIQDNPFKDTFLGMTPADGPLMQMTRAGLSTGIGFWLAHIGGYAGMVLRERL